MGESEGVMTAVGFEWEITALRVNLFGLIRVLGREIEGFGRIGVDGFRFRVRVLGRNGD